MIINGRNIFFFRTVHNKLGLLKYLVIVLVSPFILSRQMKKISVCYKLVIFCLKLIVMFNYMMFYFIAKLTDLWKYRF